MSIELDISSSEAQVPSSEAQFNRIFRVTFLPKLPKAVLMWVIEVISTVLVGNFGPRFDLAAFVLEKPLLWENLKQDAVLKILAVIRQPNATNCKITQQEW